MDDRNKPQTLGDLARQARDSVLWLDVPIEEKEEAKALGARWDPAARRWYAPRLDMPGLDRWQPLPDLPDLLPGEDRSFGGSGLFVDLVPRSCWFTQARSCVSRRDWERLRRMVTNRAGHCCEVCHRGEDRGSRRWLEVHERWAFDDERRVQTLRRLICLCTDCHTTTHYGLAGLNDKGEQAFQHLCAITGMSEDEAMRHVITATGLYRERSDFQWELNLSVLTDAGITVQQPPRAEERASIARSKLSQQDVRRRVAEIRTFGAKRRADRRGPGAL